MKKLLYIFGTRPEAIKMAPLILEGGKRSDAFSVQVCVTGQHRDMLDQVLDFFKIKPDYDLDLMQPNQSLDLLTSRCITSITSILSKCKPNFVIVQGDTTTAMASALASYYLKIPVVHVEAGLRSNNKYSPFPEEINRKIISQIAYIHFAVTESSQKALMRESITENVFVVGNTVIDALKNGATRIKGKSESISSKYPDIDFKRKILLVTGHRRESFGKPFKDICFSLKKIANEFKDEITIIYPVHLNPNVRDPVYSLLSGIANIHLINPLNYPDFIWFLNEAFIVLTDSGGIQEEAPSLGKPVLVLREVTERIEGIAAGNAILVGTDPEKIYENTYKLITDPAFYSRMVSKQNPYGDGESANQNIRNFGEYSKLVKVIYINNIPAPFMVQFAARMNQFNDIDFYLACGQKRVFTQRETLE